MRSFVPGLVWACSLLAVAGCSTFSAPRMPDGRRIMLTTQVVPNALDEDLSERERRQRMQIGRYIAKHAPHYARDRGYTFRLINDRREFQPHGAQYLTILSIDDYHHPGEPSDVLVSRARIDLRVQLYDTDGKTLLLDHPLECEARKGRGTWRAAAHHGTERAIAWITGTLRRHHGLDSGD